MSRAINFSAGPAALPLPVLEQARSELLDWRGIGASVMEISHRSAEFTDIARQAEADLRALLQIPDDYAVLFLQGGAQMQFSMVPLNLLDENQQADYIDTGYWSRLAITEARRYARVNIAASGEAYQYLRIPPYREWALDPGASYVHFTPNETLVGLEFHRLPEVGTVPLVADMSSTILSRPIPIQKYGLIYAGAQKNVGPSGLTLVIVRHDLLGRTAAQAPKLFDYQRQQQAGSMANTVPTFAWYIAGLVFKWLLQLGGLEVVAGINEKKAMKLYECIDRSDGFYINHVSADARSWMNVSFHLGKPDLETLFLQKAEQAGMIGLKGHRAVGGMRASIYNAVSEQDVNFLVEFMNEFRYRYD